MKGSPPAYEVITFTSLKSGIAGGRYFYTIQTHGDGGLLRPIPPPHSMERPRSVAALIVTRDRTIVRQNGACSIAGKTASLVSDSEFIALLKIHPCHRWFFRPEGEIPKIYPKVREFCPERKTFRFPLVISEVANGHHCHLRFYRRPVGSKKQSSRPRAAWIYNSKHFVSRVVWFKIAQRVLILDGLVVISWGGWVEE